MGSNIFYPMPVGFLGFFATSASLIATYPTASAGKFAIVGDTDTVWVWDTDTNSWTDTGAHSAVTSVFGRMGAITAQAGDYTPDQLGFVPNHGVEARPVGASNPLPTHITTSTFTLGALANPIAYWFNGARILVNTNKTTTLPGVAGLYFIYFDGITGNIINSLTTPGFTTADNVFICAVQWNGSNYGLVNDERHGYRRSLPWHDWAHNTIGTRYRNGLALTASGTGAAATFSVTAGEIRDEDIVFAVPASSAWPTPNAGRHFYQSGASVYSFDAAVSTVPFKRGANNRPVMVRASDSALTEMSSAVNRYINIFVYATDDLHTPIYFFTESVSDAVYAANGYTSLDNARAVGFPLLSGYMLSAELKPIYRLVVRADGVVQAMLPVDDYRTVTSLSQSSGVASLPASAVVFTPTSTIAATNAQAAIQEVEQESQRAVRTTVNNADYTILDTDSFVAQIGTMSAVRTFTLPSAATYKAGQMLTVVDESGTVGYVNTLSIVRAGADTIQGATGVIINIPYGKMVFVSNGSNMWTFRSSVQTSFNQLSNLEKLRILKALDNLTTGTYIHEPFLNGQSGSWWGTVVVGSGVITGVSSPDSLRIGVAQLSTGTDTTGAITLRSGIAPFTFGEGVVWTVWLVYIPDLATVGDDYVIRVGFGDNSNAASVDGAYFEYNRSVSANWRISATNNSTQTITTTSTVVAAAGWLEMAVACNAAGTLLTFYINGVSVGTINTNIPTTPARAFGSIAMIVKTAGTTARTILIDDAFLYVNPTTPKSSSTFSYLPE